MCVNIVKVNVRFFGNALLPDGCPHFCEGGEVRTGTAGGSDQNDAFMRAAILLIKKEDMSIFLA